MSHARTTDPSTSHAAASGVDLNARCTEVLLCIWTQLASPFTDGQIAAAMNEDRNIVARRRQDLVEAGLVRKYMKGDVHQEVPGRRGRMEKQWLLTPAGIDVAASITR